MFYFLALFVFCVKLSCQDCHLCSSCNEDKSLPMDPYCFCDSDCEVFGDCCGSLYPPTSCPPSSLEPLQHGATFECHPTQWNESNFITRPSSNSFLMVSSCPACYEYHGRNSEFIDLCTSEDILLPPVTDSQSGLAFRNQYCAQCNGVETFLTWQIKLVCHERHKGFLSSLSFVTYSDIAAIFGKCLEGYYIPPTNESLVRNPRPCVNSINSCLPKVELEDFIGSLSMINYMRMDNNCSLGERDLSVGTDGLVYRNLACAECNGINNSYCPSNNTLEKLSINLNSNASVVVINSSVVAVYVNHSTSLIPVECLEWDKQILGFFCNDMVIFNHTLWNSELCNNVITIGNLKCISNVLIFENNNTTIPCLPISQCREYALQLDNSTLEHADLDSIEAIYKDNENLYICHSSSFEEKVLFYTANFLSIIGATLTVLTNVLFRETRSFPSTILLNFLLPVFIINLLNLIHNSLSHSVAIKVDAVLFHYFSLVKLTWMAIFSFEVLRKFIQGRKMKTDSKNTRNRYAAAYLIIGWISAIMIVIPTVAVDNSNEELVIYAMNDNASFIIENTVVVWLALILPAALLTLFSISIFCITSCLICKMAWEKSKLKKTANWTLFRLWIGIMLLSGLPYLTYLIVEPTWLHLIHVFYTDAEGFIIFVAFFLSKKVLLLYYQLIFKRPCYSCEKCCTSTGQSNMNSKTCCCGMGNVLENFSTQQHPDSGSSTTKV